MPYSAWFLVSVQLLCQLERRLLVPFRSNTVRLVAGGFGGTSVASRTRIQAGDLEPITSVPARRS